MLIKRKLYSLYEMRLLYLIYTYFYNMILFFDLILLFKLFSILLYSSFKKNTLFILKLLSKLAVSHKNVFF